MRFLNIDHEWVHVDHRSGGTRTPEFEAMNVNLKIPVLQIGESEYLAESNAILNYLAADSEFLPSSGLERAKVLQWQFFEQASHMPFLAVARMIKLLLGMPEERKEEYLSKLDGGHKALSIMEGQLSRTQFLVSDKPTTADVSLYAYTHVAHEGGFELEKYPSIQNWLSCIKALPGYVTMSKESE